MNVFEFTFYDATFFSKLIKALGTFVDDVHFVADRESLKTRFMFDSHVMMLDFFMSKKAFDEYYVSDDVVNFTLELKPLIKSVFKNVKRCDVLKMGIDRDKLEAEFTLRHRQTRKYIIPVSFEVPEEVVPVPKITFTAKAKFCISILDNLLKDLAKFNDEVKVTACHKGLIFDGSDKNGTMYTMLVEPSSEDLLSFNKPNERIIARFNRNNLTQIVKALKPLVDVIEFSFSNHFPLKIGCDLLNDIRLDLWLAPRILEEDLAK